MQLLQSRFYARNDSLNKILFNGMESSATHATTHPPCADRNNVSKDTHKDGGQMKLMIIIITSLSFLFAGGCMGDALMGRHLEKARENITPFGPDTYTVTYTGTNYSAVRTIVFKVANERCSEMNKTFLPKNETQHYNSVELVFRCLKSDDPELKRPNWEARPDTVIEDRRTR